MDKLERMKELIAILDEASRAYYQEAREIMPNERYDALYDELLSLEEETGTVLSGSPTHQVGYEVLSELPKERHEKAALSLDKTKDPAVLSDFLGEQKGVLSWKLDGLTVVLTYENGELLKAVTRGNGEIGEVVTQNARTFKNLPLTIPYKGHLVLRGEAVIKYSDFERINEGITEDAKYKNPRNLCSGAVRQLDSSVTAKRSVNLIAFSLIEAEGVDVKNSMNEQLNFLDSQGFETVERMIVTGESVADAVRVYSEKIVHYDIPSDGLVLVMDDLAYGASLGRTAKFPRNAIAFKWQDEMAETTLRGIEWSASRTGLINPVALFDPVELEGTTVSRASVHNVSVMEELGLGVGDTVKVYKANMIIPQISENLTRSGTLKAPCTCPVCGGETSIHDENGVRTLYCTNPECPAKQIKRFGLLVSRNALNIEGLSEKTLERFIDLGFIKTLADVYRLDRYKEEITTLEGFGLKSYQNLQEALEASRETTLSRVLYAVGIKGIGVSTARLLSSEFHDDLEQLLQADLSMLSSIRDIGDKTAEQIYEHLHDERKLSELRDLLSELRLQKPEDPAAENGEDQAAQFISGKTFVVTGSVSYFKNRDELKELIESKGGKNGSAVSKNTDYLINNDKMSNSTKNKKARELGIAIISEEEFLALSNLKREEA